MTNKIAVIVNDKKELSSFENGSIMNIYYKGYNNWELQEEIPYSLNTSLPMSEIRDYIRTVILRLDDCKIVIGKVVSGLTYNIFDRMGFAIFEADNISDYLLDEIASDVQTYTSVEIDLLSKVSASPIQTEIAGIYFLNLIELQENHPEISSKKALQSFIDTTPFYQLELICSHVPQWFEHSFPSINLEYTTEELKKNKYRVIIYKKVCES